MFLFKPPALAATLTPGAEADSAAPDSFEHRLAALQRGGRRVAYYYAHPEHGTFRYRVYNMIQALNGLSPDISAAHFTVADLHRMEPVLQAADILVVCRAVYTGALGRVIARARSLGRAVLFDIDDLIFDIDYAHTVMDAIDHDPEQDEAVSNWFGHIARLGATMKLCDRVLVTNHCLAQHAHAFAGLPVSVLPNFLNREQMAASELIFDLKARSGFQRSERLHVGYFSGSATHNKDFAVVAPALERLMDEFPDLHLRIVGFLDLPAPLLRHAARIERHALTDFLTLQRLIAETEINIVPLRDNAFTNCKSELKYFEAAIAGTPSVASPSFVFRHAIQDGRNGHIAHSLDWHAKLTALAANPDALQPLARAAFIHARQHFDWSTQLPAIERALFA